MMNEVQRQLQRSSPESLLNRPEALEIIRTFWRQRLFAEDFATDFWMHDARAALDTAVPARSRLQTDLIVRAPEVL